MPLCPTEWEGPQRDVHQQGKSGLWSVRGGKDGGGASEDHGFYKKTKPLKAVLKGLGEYEAAEVEVLKNTQEPMVQPTAVRCISTRRDTEDFTVNILSGILWRSSLWLQLGNVTDAAPSMKPSGNIYGLL